MVTQVFRYGECTEWSTQRLHKYTEHHMFRLFSVPAGLSGQGFDRALTFADTSRVESGRRVDAFDVHAVGWEVFGGTSKQREQILRQSCWYWDFTQVLVAGAPLSTTYPGSKAFDREALRQRAAREEAGVLTNVEKAEIALLDFATAGREHSSRGCLAYEKHPVALPAGCCFAILLKLGFEVPYLEEPIDLKFTLFGTYRHVIDIA